jgi:hypothetical protein
MPYFHANGARALYRNLQKTFLEDIHFLKVRLKSAQDKEKIALLRAEIRERKEKFRRDRLSIRRSLF